MSIKLKKVSRKNPLQPSQSKWYLTQETAGSVGMTEIAREIAGKSALSHGDVLSVLTNFVEILPTFLKLGQSVRLEGFGSFRISVRSDGKENVADLSARDVRSARLIFLPGSGLKRSLEDLSYEVIESGQVSAGNG